MRDVETNSEGKKGERRRREATHPDAAVAGLVFNHRKATADRFDPAWLPSKETHNDASETRPGATAWCCCTVSNLYHSFK